MLPERVAVAQPRLPMLMAAGPVQFQSTMWGNQMKALISPNEKVYNYAGTLIGERVAQVTDAPFPVCEPLFWVNCANDVVADQFYYDPSNGNILRIPEGPSIQAKFAPNPVFVGQETVLTWNVQNATAVTLSSYGSQQFPLSGSMVFTYPTFGSKEEVVTAIALDGNVPRTVKVTVVATQAEMITSGDAPITVI
jgi:hypothetical protein